MTQPPSERQHDLPNREIEELLPWYVNRTLQEPERANVERHVADSPELQAHLAAWQHLAEGVRAIEVVAPEPSSERFAALMAQIDAAIEPPASKLERRPWVRLIMQWRAWHQSWLNSPGTAPFALALQCVLIVLCIAGITLQWPWSPPTFYHSLSQEVTTGAPSRGRLRLVVADDMTMGELRTLLGRIQATVIDGPSTVGAYTLAVPLDSHAVLPEALLETLQILRAHEHVTLAEPML
ncbi:MAG: hypothetical protein ETSY1_31010 [Candidatus Entotheonella factor]|uniref:Putative zinc-finger domain-containing protein n=1 Tax=Entotheonella factor TaxID=1429438 RepID=W4LDH5_ENTF1|nr:zf-HC2 domain-containing protein [Candidatus Entotheonella palauensis]ETW95346.1 MAG: hypothetical protein ETSY1_31010 [Candidatus Entotheonella factor]